MTLADKIDNLYVERERKVKKGRGVKSKKQRIIGLLLSILLIAFSLVPKYLKKDFGFDILTVACIVKAIFSLITAFTKKSLFQYNHGRIYSVIKFITKFSTLIIAVYAMIGYYNYFNGVISMEEWTASTNIREEGIFMYIFKYGFEAVKQLFYKSPTNTIMLFVTIIINIPLVGYFFVVLITYITYLMPIVIFRWLGFVFGQTRVFYEYAECEDDPDYYVIRKRIINTKWYGTIVFLRRIIVSCLMVGLIILILYCNGIRSFAELTNIPPIGFVNLFIISHLIDVVFLF